MNRRFLMPLWLLIAAQGLADPSARAETPPPLSRIVAAVERAEAKELARLHEAITASTDRAEILALQRCAAYVKLTGRLVLCEERLGRTGDEAEKARLFDAADVLRGKLERQVQALPGGYAYDPLALLEREVQPCAE